MLVCVCVCVCVCVLVCVCVCVCVYNAGRWQGADLHSFLESLRTPGRAPGQGMRMLLSNSNDNAALPLYLTQHPSLFSFRFSPEEDAGSAVHIHP